MQREARAASALDHPNICAIYELDEHEGRPFIVMQLLEGKTLRQWIENSASENKHERLNQLLDLAVQIADGLEAAHQKGIIHRDIKPANIFITSRGEAKILDFGVAKFLDLPDLAPALARRSQETAQVANPALTRTGASMGTPSYLSPEQIRGEKLDARSDLFSLGLVLYEMATGCRAFAGDTAAVIREAVLNQPAIPVRQLAPEQPLQLQQIITKALEKDRERKIPVGKRTENQSGVLAPRKSPSGKTSHSVLEPAQSCLRNARCRCRRGCIPERESQAVEECAICNHQDNQAYGRRADLQGNNLSGRPLHCAHVAGCGPGIVARKTRNDPE